MRETNATYTYYRADGFKTSRLNRTIYITTATKVNSKGETIVYDKTTGVDNLRQYYGNLMKENGKVKHIYNEAGYVDVHEDDGTYCYNFYVRDYLGSTRAIVSQWGDLAQTTDYYPSGVPTSEYKSYWLDDRLHTGKEFNAFNGLFWYDNSARMLDPIFNRFTTPDPLAEKYPGISPYAHCMNNPLKFIDPDGRDNYYLDENGGLRLFRKEEDKTRITTTSEIEESIEIRSKIVVETRKLTGTDAISGEKISVNGTFLTFSNSDDAKKVFEFLARYTNVEFAIAYMEKKAPSLKREKTVVSTSHELDGNTSQDEVIRTNSQTFNFKRLDHSHPQGTKDISEEDQFAKTTFILNKLIDKNQSKNPTFNIYPIYQKRYPIFHKYQPY